MVPLPQPQTISDEDGVDTVMMESSAPELDRNYPPRGGGEPERDSRRERDSERRREHRPTRDHRSDSNVGETSVLRPVLLPPVTIPLSDD